ncbi:MAG: MFS transporter [archaeon]
MFDKYTGSNRSLKVSVIEGVFASILLLSAVAFVVPYALYLGASSVQIAFLIAFPTLLASWLQIFSVKLLEIVKSRKRIVVVVVLLQSAAMLGFVLIPFIDGIDKVTWLIVCYTVAIMIGTLGSPVWQSWMKALTPEKMLGKYFGFRNSVTIAFSFVTLIFFGYLLGLFQENPLWAFIFIFIIAVIGRTISGILSTKMDDPIFEPEPKRERVGFIKFVYDLQKTNFWYFLLFGGLMTFAVSMVGPFLSMYMLNDLKIGYFDYTLIIASSTFASIISMPYWGKLIDRHGTIKILKATSLLLVVLPISFIFVKSVLGLMVILFFDGIIIAGFNLALANFVYDYSSQQKIIRFASYQAFFFGTASFIGLMISGFIQGYNFSFGFITSAFYLVCAISAIIRYITYKILITKVKEVKEVKKIHSAQIVFNVLTLVPLREIALANTPVLLESGAKSLRRSIIAMEEVGEKGVEEFEKVGKKGFKAVNTVGDKSIQAISSLRKFPKHIRDKISLKKVKK